MSSKSERNDRKSGKKQVFGNRPDGPRDKGQKPAAQGFGRREETPRQPRSPDRGKSDADNFLWGRHPVLAALANPARRGMGRLLATAERAAEIENNALANGHRIEVVDIQTLTRMLPPGAVHQGLAFKVQPLEGVSLEDLAEPAEGVIVMLDQLTDPQNVGAIFRSALAFGARGIIVQDRHAPALAGALAKAAVGATERLPHARVTNLSRALERLADLGWRAVGLDGTGEQTLEEALDHQPTVLVMGSEGDGIRRLVAEHCDVLAKIPMPGGFESLNVSNAAAVALYEAARAQRG
ncbi:23S rRNA (guanosine(2251)-2'-O)-methyltransferase RlmB [Brevundimonas sp. KM4]|uniref:23S rRNA (guanosine(2251)-2'-O)-methyltransferase RlmB n=1 Tax=Brevundimonas sp. KM4 TaxID=1628191 RepID=UPI0009E1C2AE|nr:23S rRNA (guanosine(2251)-2'-O)-methyltransferase RlmB [Brevundimonas sp. KM4]